MTNTQQVGWWSRLTNAVNGAVIAEQTVGVVPPLPATTTLAGREKGGEGGFKDSYHACAGGDPKCIANASSNFKFPLLFGGLSFLSLRDDSAWILHRTGRGLEAIAIYKGVAAEYAEMGEHGLAANSFWKLGNIQREMNLPAGESFSNAAKHYGLVNDKHKQGNALRSVGDAHVAVGNHAEAGNAYLTTAEFFKKQGDNPAGIYLLAARSYEKADQLDDAVRLFDKAAENFEAPKTFPSIVEAGAARVNQADALQRMGKGDEAKAIYARAAETIATITEDRDKRVRLTPEQLHEALFLRGEALERAGMREQAVEVYLRLYEQRLDRSSEGWLKTNNARYRAAILLGQIGEHEKAAAIFEGIAGDKKSSSESALLGDARLERGRALKDGGLYHEAIGELGLAENAIGAAARRFEEDRTSDHTGMARYLRGFQEETVTLRRAIIGDPKYNALHDAVDGVIKNQGGAMESLAETLGVNEQELEYALRDEAGRLYERLRRTIGAEKLGVLAGSHLGLQSIRPGEERRDGIERAAERGVGIGVGR